MAKINVKDTDIVFYRKEQEDYISLTDIAKVRDKENQSQIISLWMRTYSTIGWYIVVYGKCCMAQILNPTFMRGLKMLK